MKYMLTLIKVKHMAKSKLKILSITPFIYELNKLYTVLDGPSTERHYSSQICSVFPNIRNILLLLLLTSSIVEAGAGKG